MVAESLYYVYSFKIGDRVLYVGKTKNPDERQREHERQNPKGVFALAQAEPMTDEDATRWEKEQLQQLTGSVDVQRLGLTGGS